MPGVLIFCSLLPSQDETIYDRLKKQNLFAPEVKRPRPPDPPRVQKDETPEEPAPPQPSAFDVAGIVFNTATQAYEVLIVDRDESDGSYLKAGDTLHGATVAEVGEGKVTIAIGEKTQELSVGQNYELLVKGRSGGGRSRPAPSESSPSTSSAPAASTGRTGGLLDAFRRRRTEAAPTAEAPAVVSPEDAQGGLIEKWKKWKEANP